MAQSKVFDTGGLAGDWAQVGGVQNTETYRAPAVRGEQRSRTAKDFIADASVLQTDLGTNEDNVNRATPEAGVYTGVVAASLTTALTGTNNDLVFTAKPLGSTGNLINVTYVDPGGTTATLGVVVTGFGDIVVNLGRTASAIDTTATALKAAVDASAAASALVSVANAGADNGTGLVTALAKSFLTGGSDGTRVV